MPVPTTRINLSAGEDIAVAAQTAHPSRHMPCLDGLRGLAAIMVVLGHAGDFSLPSFVDGGASHCGVLIFFALSGFLMGDLYLVTPPTRARVKAYGAARIARIVPIYYLVILAAFAIYWLDPSFPYAVTPIQLIRLLTFNGSTSVFWSIGPEVQFYAVFIFLWLLHGRLKNDALFAGIVLALCGLGLATIHRWPGVFVASKFHIFALGMLAALLRQRLSGRLPRIAVAAGHVIALVILAVFVVPGVSHWLLGATPFDRQTDPGFTSFYGNVPRVLLATYLALALSFDSRVGALLLANSVSALLGRCSFSIYLLHVAVYDAGMRSGALAHLPGWAATLSVLLVTIGLSACTYYLIEAPLRHRARAALLQLIQESNRLRVQKPRPA